MNLTFVNKGALMMDIENQKNHYRTMLHPRKAMKIAAQGTPQAPPPNKYLRNYSLHVRDRENLRLAHIL